MFFIYAEIAIIALVLLIVYVIKSGPKGPTDAARHNQEEVKRILTEKKPMQNLPTDERAKALHQLEQDISNAEKQAKQLDEPLLAFTLSSALEEVKRLREQHDVQQNQIH